MSQIMPPPPPPPAGLMIKPSAASSAHSVNRIDHRATYLTIRVKRVYRPAFNGRSAGANYARCLFAVGQYSLSPVCKSRIITRDATLFLITPADYLVM